MLKMVVEVGDDRVQPALKAAARKVSQQQRIAGFRPGKAPYDLVVRQVGEAALYEVALEELGQKVYAEALDQEKIEAYGPGAMEDMQLKPLVLTFHVPLKPVVDLGEYRALRVPYTPPEVNDDDVQEVMESLRSRQATDAPVDRPAQLGDVVTVDVNAFINEGLNPSDFLLSDKGVELVLEPQADWPAPGFAPHVVGQARDEVRKFDLTFPDDYANESLRGTLAHFEVTCREVKARSLPEWDDELARSLGDYENLDDLRTKVRADLVRHAERTTERDYANEVMDKLLEQTSLKYPPVLLDQETDDLMHDLDHRLREQRLTLEDYLKIEGKTGDQLREEYRPRAEQRLKRALVLGRVVELEKLTVDRAEIDARVETMSALWGDRAGEARQALSTAQARRSLELELLTDKAVQRVAAIARGEIIPSADEAVTEESSTSVEAAA